jgi:signal recognition particle receptor subunit beta
MVQINMSTKEITMKVVYYGPALSGKTTNLAMLHKLMTTEGRRDMVTLDTKDDRTLYFDFLPIEFPTAGGFSVKMKLFTVPGQVMHRSTRKVVLAGADAVVFICDSQKSAASANQYSWRDMEANLKANGIDFKRLPKVVQFNKRDCEDVKPLDDIQAAWGDIPTCPAIATQGVGVVETFRELLRALYQGLDEKHDFSAKFGVSEEGFLKGVLQTFSGVPDSEEALKAL